MASHKKHPKITKLALVACRPCYDQMQLFLATAAADTVAAAPVRRWLDYVTVTNNPSECPMAGCESRKNARHSEHTHGPDDEHGCPHGGNPDVCECDLELCCEEECKSKQKAVGHRKILGKINEIEVAYNELIRAVDETVHMRLPINHGLEIAPITARDPGFQTKLKRFNSNCVQFDLNEEQVQAPPGRPFCAVWCNSLLHCHIDKINHYSPTNCDCTKNHQTGNILACPCFSCVLRHVEHCAEDYQDALRRVRLGVSKLQAVSRKNADTVPTAGVETGTFGGCAMPGVRKAKNLSNYTKAQKDRHNGGSQG